MKQKTTNPAITTVGEIVEKVNSILEPIEDVTPSEEDITNNKAAVILLAKEDSVLTFSCGSAKMQGIIIAQLLKRQPILLMAVLNEL